MEKINLQSNSCIIIKSTRIRNVYNDLMSFAYDEKTQDFINLNTSPEALVRELHDKYGYHKFTVFEDYEIKSKKWKKILDQQIEAGNHLQ